MASPTPRDTFRLLLLHALLAIGAATFFPWAMHRWQPSLVPHFAAGPIMFVSFAQMTLLCHYFALGRHWSLPIRAIALVSASIVLACLIAMADRHGVSVKAPYDSIIDSYPLTLVPVPFAGLSAACLAIDRFRIRRRAQPESATRHFQFRSVHLILLTLFVACLLAVLEWYPTIRARDTQQLEAHWKRIGAINFAKSNLIFWSIDCGVIGYASFRSCLTRGEATSESIAILIGSVAAALIAGALFLAPPLTLWCNYLAGTLIVAATILATCFALKRRGYMLVRVK